MAIERMSDETRDSLSVGALADRPNSTARDGFSGLTPTQLKAKFDALPKAIVALLNEVIDAINGETAEASLLSLLETPVEYEGERQTLWEVLARLDAGAFAPASGILPPVTAADVGKFMTVDEAGNWIAKRLDVYDGETE